MLTVEGFRLRDVPAVVGRSAQIAGILTPLIAVSVVMQQVLGDLGADDVIGDLLTSMGGYFPVLFMSMAIVFVSGMILESLPVTIILAPILAPIAASVGVDPVHFSVIFLVGASIGFITPPVESATGPGEHQVVPIVHSASTFNEAGDLFILSYRTNYESSANVMAGTGNVDYGAPQIVIGRVPSATLIAANNGANDLNATWSDVDDSSDAVCAAVVNQFRDQTNTFSDCVVADFIASGDHDAAVDSCLASSGIMNRGIHDFAVHPSNGHFYAYDSQTYNDKDVLIDVDPNTMVASCTEYADAGNGTGRLTSLMFSQQDKLVALFADETNGVWIDTTNGNFNNIAATVTAYPHGDGSSIPFNVLRHALGTTLVDLIFKNGFEDFIFANGFEGDPIPPTCPAF